MRTPLDAATPLLFGPPGRPTVLVVRTILFTGAVVAGAAAAAVFGPSTEVGLLAVGAAALGLLGWTRTAVRRAHGYEERLARAEARDVDIDGEVHKLTDRFQAMLLDYEELQRAAAEQRAELNGTVRERTAALMAANRRLERIDHMKDEFVSLLAHELRTPLTSVRTYVELLLEYDEKGVHGSERREFLEIIRSQARRVSRLILEILDLSRLRAGRFEFTFGDHDAARAIEEAVEDYAEATDSAPPRIVLHRPAAPVEARCDRSRLVQILATLLENAFEHGGDSAPVDVAWTADGDRVRITVSDHGDGVPPAERESIFEPFHKTRRDGQSTTSGTGLALYLGREFARKMDGDLWVEETDGGGARFVVSLPNAAASAPKPAALEPSPAGA